MNTVNTQNSIDFEGVAKAVAQYCSAASTQLGVDCFIHAYFAQSLLKRLGVESELVVGEAAWRVGPDYNDVLSHLFSGFGHGPMVGFHCWLLVDGKIFDPTTYLIPMKVKQLDEMDGMTTTVDFAPEHLLTESSEVLTNWEEFLGVLKAGTTYYLRLPEVENVIKEAYTADKDDEEMVWHIYQNKPSHVVGPNQKAA